MGMDRERREGAQVAVMLKLAYAASNKRITILNLLVYLLT